MPLTAKGEEILHNMEQTYGSEAKAKSVFYASKNAGKITGVDEAAVIDPQQSAASTLENLPQIVTIADMRKWSGH